MSGHAGFAAALAIREATLNELIRALHHGDQLPHALAGGFAGTSADFFLERPTLACSAESDNRLILTLTAHGPLTVTDFGGDVSTRTVLFRARVLAPPRLTLDSGSLTFNVDGLAAVLDWLDIIPVAGGPYPAPAQAIIDSDLFRNGVETLIQQQLNALEQLAPPLSLSFLGDIAAAEGNTVTAVLLDDVIVIGIDVNDAEGITTNGDASELTDITDGNDIAMWSNPVALPVLMATVREKIDDAVSDADATLTELSFSLIEGAFHIAGHADKGADGSVDFTLDAVPHLIRPGHHEEWDEEYGGHFEIDTPAREELWFESTNVNVDVNRPWWAYLLSVLGALFTAGLGTLIVELFVDMVRNNVGGGIVGGGGDTVAARVQQFTFAGMTEPTFRLKIESYECHEEGVFAGMTLRPQIRAARVNGPSSVAVEQVRGTTIAYVVTLPFDAHPEDPMLLVRWTVRRTDTNAIVRAVDLQAEEALTFDLTGERALLAAPEFRIACRVYHTLGPLATTLFSTTVALRITDVLDRSHPFVRWRHVVNTPVVRVERDGSHTELGFSLADRCSSIHRTDVPGRCRMASRYSSKVSRTNDRTPSLEYLDALPFPHDQIVARRGALCDYCFFGGPDKSAPLV
jgi:hypothetical protein